jgi:hypothetical protein
MEPGVTLGCGIDGRVSLHTAQTGSGAHPASVRYPRGPRLKGCEAGHSPPSSAEVKNGGALPPHLHMSSWPTAYFHN